MTHSPLSCFSILLLVSLGLTACGPGRAVQKYDYLTKDAKRYNRDERKDDASTHPSTSASHPTPAHSASDAEIIVQTALSYEGTPYQYGGTSRRGMDCSGLINASYQAADRYVPRTSSQMAAEGKKVALDQVQPGNLLLFSAKRGSSIDHVGLVVEVNGNDIAFIHATTSAGVRVDRLSDEYWDKRFRRAVAF
jgi:cell wall-associated NlpC family hydrolase